MEGWTDDLGVIVHTWFYIFYFVNLFCLLSEAVYFVDGTLLLPERL